MNFPAALAQPGSFSLPVHGVSSARPPLVVFSSQRWAFDWQRPQQLLTRLAKHYGIIYVEEPVTTHQDAYLECTAVADGVEVLLAHTRRDERGFHDAQIGIMGVLLTRFLRERGIVEPLVWLDTPAALPLAEALAPRGMLYDCHADLAAASGDDALRAREARLMRRANVVLAGGPSLYESHRDRHASVHCIANAVDGAHFAPPLPAGASIEAVSARAIHAAIPNPRLGFFGVIDERLDLDLLARIADLRPDWQFVLAGPVRGIDPATLPRRGNLLWLGPQTYAILPHLQAHWDACILPLRRDTSLRHAAPVELLEFLAGHKSVVSTPVHDVVALHGHIVRLAHDASAFVEACRAAMCERGPLRRQRRIDALIAVHSCTWERAAERVHRLLSDFAHEAGGPSPEVAAALLGTVRRDMRHASGVPR